MGLTASTPLLHPSAHPPRPAVLLSPTSPSPSNRETQSPEFKEWGWGMCPVVLPPSLLFNIKMRQKAKYPFEIIHAKFWLLFPSPIFPRHPCKVAGLLGGIHPRFFVSLSRMRFTVWAKADKATEEFPGPSCSKI